MPGKTLMKWARGMPQRFTQMSSTARSIVAHFVHLAAQRVAQLFHDLGGEADAQQLVAR